jgi:tellurite resistance protein TerC
MPNEILFLSGFLIIILVLLFIDLGLFSKQSHVLSYKESLYWTTLWVGLAIGFYFFIRHFGHLMHGIGSLEELARRISEYKHPVNIAGLGFEEALKVYDRTLSLQYLTGYIIEYSLSLDNVFVILLIFISFNVPEKYYKRVLFWGILGAIVMRFIFIFALSALIHKADWILYIFGAFLIFTAVKMMLDFMKHEEKKIDVEHHPMVRLAKRFFRVHPRFEEEKFWIRKNGKLLVTPLFLVLLVIEFSDLIFAIDSVPAIFAVSRDPFIVFFSNIFAIMGLRSLFFLVSHLFRKFYYLKVGLAALLGFIGIKMSIHGLVDIPIELSLVIILGIILISVVASFLRRDRKVHGKV